MIHNRLNADGRCNGGFPNAATYEITGWIDGSQELFAQAMEACEKTVKLYWLAQRIRAIYLADCKQVEVEPITADVYWRQLAAFYLHIYTIENGIPRPAKDLHRIAWEGVRYYRDIRDRIAFNEFRIFDPELAAHYHMAALTEYQDRGSA